MNNGESYKWKYIDSPWISADLEIWSDLFQDHIPRKYEAGQNIFNQGDRSEYFYIVVKGRVCVSVSGEEGQQKHIYIACPGAMFGENSCILDQCHQFDATAIVRSECYCIPSKEVHRIFYQNPRIADMLLQYVARKNRMLVLQNSILSFDSASKRITSILVNLTETYGVPVKNGYYIDLKFTNSDIANIANTSRVTVNNVFSLLQEEKILYKNKSQYTVLNLDKLRNFKAKSKRKAS